MKLSNFLTRVLLETLSINFKMFLWPFDDREASLNNLCPRQQEAAKNILTFCMLINDDWRSFASSFWELIAFLSLYMNFQHKHTLAVSWMFLGTKSIYDDFSLSLNFSVHIFLRHYKIVISWENGTLE